MSSNYDRNVQVSREEEGMYHLRETESKPRNYTSRSYEVVPVKSRHEASKPIYTSDSDNDNFEEWTVSKKKVNHKTRQVETRVSRQLLVEDGRVIADSGPQVTTRIKEDNKVEECEREKAPKNKDKFDALENAPEGSECSGRVLGEKKEIQRVSREVREENMQYHDERFKELSGQDVHRRAIHAPHELITITDKDHSSQPRGKMVHYSNKGKKYQDTDEILEVAKLAIDGSITKEVKRTRHHEECSEDEKPDETGEAEALRGAPTVTRSTRRHVDYVNDFDDSSASSSDEDTRGARHHHSTSTRKPHKHETSSRIRAEQAFPRYEIDPLLNSLNEDDFRPNVGQRSGGYKEHKLEIREKNKPSSSSDESDSYNRRSRQSQQQQVHRQQTSHIRQQSPARAVEIPEEYRINRHHKKTSSHLGGPKQQASRDFSPTGKSHLSHKSSKSNRSQWEDASVQAHLSEEEEERKSMRSSASSAMVHSHERNTRKLERQSQATRGSRRNYHYGHTPKRAASVSSSSASSSDENEKMRKDGVRSRDSGFKSPHSTRTDTPYSTGSQQKQQPIYAVSSKSKKYQQPRDGAVSPTPSNASQRSVRTTTRTFSAGLEDKPERKIRSYAATTERMPSSEKRSMRSPIRSGAQEQRGGGTKTTQVSQRKINADKHKQERAERNSLDSVSLSSLGPLATTIKVPYMKEKSTPHYDTIQPLPDATPRREAMEPVDQRQSADSRQNHFNYRTIITNIHPPPVKPKQQVVDTYNVRVVEHSSPFSSKLAPVNSVSELSNSIARLEILSSELDSITLLNRLESEENNTTQSTVPDNNNSTAFNLNHFIKHKALPVRCDYASSDSLVADPDNLSLQSSESLRSSRTYHVRSASNTNRQVGELTQGQPHYSHLQHDCLQDDDDDDEKFNDEKYFPVGRVEQLPVEQREEDGKKPKAWIFDPTDGSTTNIIAPPKPEEPKPAKVDSKELSEARGGRAYYLQLVEPNLGEEQVEEKKSSISRPIVESTIQQRWSSQGNLQGFGSSPIDRRPTDALQLNKNISSTNSINKRPKTTATYTKGLTNQTKLLSATKSNIPPAAGTSSPSFPLSDLAALNRSKSSSCLTVSSTRPSKYSIYGGLRERSDSKPVPRLSYSKAIGPRSQRQAEHTPKTPSRYLKMR